MFEFLVIFLLICAVINYMLRAKAYKGPKSDHFNGKHFHNFHPEREYSPTFARTIKTVFFVFTVFVKKHLDSVHWKKKDLPHGQTVPKQNIIGGEIVVTFINHATVLIQTECLNIITDPIWAKRASPFPLLGPLRYMEPGVALQSLPHIDIILLSHNHYDHMDIKTLRKISRRDHPTLYTTLGNSAYLRSRGIVGAIDMDWGQSQKFSNHITIDCVPAQHFSARAITDRKKTLWGGFVVRTPHGDIYFAGDTGYGQFVSRIREIYPNGFRFALLPIGAFEPRSIMHTSHMGPEEAITLYKELKIQRALAIHIGTFDLAFDAQDEPADQLRELLRQSKNASVTFDALLNGETMRI